MSDSYERRSISAAGAERVIAAGIAKAEAIGVPMVIAVRDESGILKALMRMDGSPLMSVEVAQAKAHTAAATSFDTHGLWEYISSEPQLLASMPAQPGMAIFGGGVPLIEAGTAIGAVGASGGSHDEDATVAEAAAAALSS
jgi:uncharacterized protein GlcG (DUF336 family)